MFILFFLFFRGVKGKKKEEFEFLFLLFLELEKEEKKFEVKKFLKGLYCWVDDMMIISELVNELGDDM